MGPSEPAGASPGSAPRLHWSAVLRALREARGVTLEGWGARLGVSRTTVQRWERGERAPDPGAEATLLTYCRESGLLRSYDRGPLAGLNLTAELLEALLAEARWRASGRLAAADRAIERAATASPEAAPPAPPPANLPAPLTSFVGRERELATVRRVQAGTRLLTLTGAGGVGKTRLALALAVELRWAYPHGLWFVDLAALADPRLLPQTVAAALGLTTTGSRAPAEDMKEFLRGRHLLLILDNCEHLLTTCAQLAEALLRASPTLAVIATSREPLGVAGETVWRVPPMALPATGERGAGSGGVSALDQRPATADHQLPDAVRLFVERARLQRPDFDLTPQRAMSIEEVCRRLDGIPLAIELAAARVLVLSIDQIAARLSDRFRLLTGGGRSALARHQTLRAAIDWSHDLLPASEQATLRRLSVFAGGFTLEAVEAVAADASALDLLASLVDKSLVIAEEQDGAFRYRLLETIRQYAAEKLVGSGEMTAVRDQHRGWFLTLAETGHDLRRGPREAEWLARMEQEHENLRAALRWSLAPGEAGAEAALRLVSALARFWEQRGHLHEGRYWLEQALAADGRASPGPRAAALRGAGGLAYAQGDYMAARSFYESSLRLSEELGERESIAETQRSLGMVALRSAEYGAARALLDASLALHVDLGNKPGIASAQNALGFLALQQGDHGTASARLEYSLVLYRELGDKNGIADTLDDLATVAGEQGDIERQAAVLEQCLDLFHELGNRGGVARVLGDLGVRAWMLGEADRALALLEESLALYREVGERRGIARVLGNQSFVALTQRDYARAAALCRESLVLYREIGDAWGIGRYLPVFAGAAYGRGQVERAARLFGAATTLRRHLGASLPPVVLPAHDRTVAAVREALGERRFATAWAEGAALSPEEAVACALADAEPA